MPKLQWNASQITTAKTPTVDAKRTIYTFEGVRNLQLESFADGRRVWRARYRVYTAGKRVDRAVTLGELKHVPPGRARTMLTDIEQKVNAGDDPWGEDRAARQAVAVEDTFNSLVLDWIHKHSKVHKRSWALDEYLHQHHIATRPLGGKTVVEIERRDIIEALDDIASQSGGAQANRVQGLISAVFSWAVDEGKLESSPAFRIRKRAKEQPRSPTITDNVIQRLWLAWGNVPDDIGDVMRLLLLTGQRCSEVCGMRVDEIQLNERLWVLPSGRNRTKNDQAHSVPLVDDAWQIVDRARKQARNGFLFLVEVQKGQ
jgi:hypothetical protein